MAPVPGMYLGIDIGTQSVKALIYDPEARAVASQGCAPLSLISRADGTREQHADWWLEALWAALASLDTGARRAVKAIGVSGQQHGCVLLDAAGAVLAPVKLWCDTATAAQCDEITAAFGGTARCIEEVGNPILPGYTASKIRWWKERCPAVYAQLATVLLPHDYINFHLTGERVMEYGDASGTGLLDIRRRQWHAGMLQAVDSDGSLAGAMPPLAGPGSTIGRLRSDTATRYALPAGIPVSTGGGDNMMAAVGTGNVSAGAMTVSLGTSGTLFASAERPVIDPGGDLAAFCSSTGAWLPLLCTMNCTVATELTRALFDLPIEQVESRVAAVPPGANGVLTVPFFNGERTPDLPGGKGCLFGLDAHNYRPDNLLRSAMEAAVYGLRSGLDRFLELGVRVGSVRITGGGARSATWRQAVADIFGLPVSAQIVDEGAALGAALHAMWTVAGGDLQSLLDTQLEVDAARTCEPDASTSARYLALYSEYRRHVDLVAARYRPAH